MTRIITRHVGNRGAVLGVLGFIWIVVAIGIANSPVVRPEIPHERLPTTVRMLFWAVPGVIAIAAVAYRKWDATAWGALLIPLAERFLSYMWAWVDSELDWWLFANSPGYPPAWRSVLIYGGFAFVVNRCAAGLDRPGPWNGLERRAWPQEK